MSILFIGIVVLVIIQSGSGFQARTTIIGGKYEFECHASVASLNEVGERNFDNPVGKSYEKEVLSEQKRTIISTREERWNNHFEQLVAFKERYGHCNVPQKPTAKIKESYSQLASFCRNVRQQYRYLQQNETKHLCFLSEERIEQLQSIGFEWSSHDAAWYSKYEELVDFWKRHGHSNVPTNWSENPSLRSWVGYQRIRYKGKNSKYKPLSPKQIKLLDSIGFRWSPKDELWWKNFAELKAFKNEHGNLNVTSSSLRCWKEALKRTCREYVLAVSIEGTTEGVHVSGLNQERLNALRELNFCWLPDQTEALQGIPQDNIFDGYE